MDNTYDVIVMGHNEGGIAAALRARHRGLRVALIADAQTECLEDDVAWHAMLHAARMCAAVHVDALVDRVRSSVRDRAADTLCMLRDHGVDVIHGTARLVRPTIFAPSTGAVAVSDDVQSTRYAEHIVIAVRGRPRQLERSPCDGDVVCTPGQLLAQQRLPQSMTIVGAGACGVAWASMMADCGASVTLLEQGPRILSDIDPQIAAVVHAQLERQGVCIQTMATATHCDQGVVYCGHRAAAPQAERILIAIGVDADVAHLGLEHTRVAIDRDNGTIVVDAHMQTQERHIYAIGASVGTNSAHAAMHQADIAVDALCGMRDQPFDETMVPLCVYSRPEAAAIGWTEEKARALGRAVDVVTVRGGSIKARMIGDDDALVRMVIDRNTRVVLGVHMVGTHATETIAVASLALLVEATAWEVGSAIYAHPTLAQVWRTAGRTLDWDVPR
ncbi:MAG: NAD(P)/FAD-dependent oxidoreductase [Paenibacillaceae bacterium]|jgi:dihydrolipoamide dehydrogenase|nr:NAD(P)/FAD-dependent oxidoreductase [Paenibacillaceae bacterium]